MKIAEIIFENMNCSPGWQESEHIMLPLNNGYIILSHRLNQNCDVDEILFVYHNKNIVRSDQDNQYGWLVSVKVKNGRIIVYEYFGNENGKDVGPFTTMESIKYLFDQLVRPYLI